MSIEKPWQVGPRFFDLTHYLVAIKLSGFAEFIPQCRNAELNPTCRLVTSNGQLERRAKPTHRKR